MQNKKLFLLIAGCAAVKFLIHILTGSNYGFFCDELYTIALSKHLAWGYVDLPPLVPALVALNRLLLGESLFAMHIVPALAGAGTLVFVCLITKEMGGRLFAVGVAGLGVLIAPVWLYLDSFFCYDSIDQLLLAAFIFFLVKLIKTGNVKIWLALGAIAGVACLTKDTILFLGPGLLLALLATKRRKDLLTPWIWAGAAIFLGIISPYGVWEYLNKWPTLEFWGIYRSQTLYHASFTEYALSTIMTMNPVLVPLLILGFYRIFRRFGEVSYAVIGITVTATFVLLISLHGRSFMLSQLFMPLIAAGAVFLEELAARVRWKNWMKAVAVTLMIAGGILVLPATVPLLPVQALPAYAKSFGFLYQPIKDFNTPKSVYPQEFSNRIGWEQLVEQVAQVYQSLSPEEQKAAGIWADWYGPAGAIDLFGPKYRLPHAVSGHMNYYLWGPGESNWQVMIFVTGAMEQLRVFFWDIEFKEQIRNDFAMPYNRLSIYVCKGPTMPPTTIWRYLKIY
jgi:hypothetical protein